MTIKKGLARFTAVATEIPRIHYRKGLETGFSGDYESAIDYFDRVNYITLGSSFWTNQSQYYKAEAYVQLEEYDKSIEEYKKFLENDKKHAKGWNNLGASYMEIYKHAEALLCFDKAIEFESKRKNLDEDTLESAWVNRGSIFVDFIADMDIQKTNPELPPAYVDNYNVYGDNLDDVRLVFLLSLENCVNEILKINSESYDGLDLKQTLFSEQNKFDESLEICKKIVQLFPDKSESWMSLAIAYDYLDNYEKSLQCYEKGIEIKPKDGLFWYNKAGTLSKINKIDDALDSLLVAISIEPEFLSVISIETEFDNIKNTERFQNFLKIPL
jgi:tetratricopeptide (TPR) repeat protein